MKPSSNVFGRTRKMKEEDDFKFAISKGAKYKFGTFHLYSYPNGHGQARLGISVSRKVSKKAVTRNALKRIIREAFRMKARELQALDLFFKVRPAKCAPDRRLLKKELTKSFCKVLHTDPNRGTA